jgi:hypothetical protein
VVDRDTPGVVDRDTPGVVNRDTPVTEHLQELNLRTSLLACDSFLRTVLKQTVGRTDLF